MKRPGCIAGMLLAGLLAGCGEPSGETSDNVVQRQVFAVGTLVEFTLVDPQGDAGQAMRNAENAMLEAEQRWRAWDDGDLAALNRQLEENGTASVDPGLAAGIRRAQELAVLSGNTFNPTIGKLVELWQFHREDRPDQPPPRADEISRYTQPVLDPAAIDISANGRIRSRDQRAWLDMGGFAKGLAVEAAIDELRTAGIGNAIVNAGGDLKTLGRHGDRDWRIGIRHPSGRGVLAALRISGATSVFTSGNYERWFEWDGRIYHHILDPETGQPADGFASATVVHPDAALADAAATALFVAGPERWTAVARAMGVDQAMVVTPDGAIHITPALHGRLEIETDAVVKVVEP